MNRALVLGSILATIIASPAMAGWDRIANFKHDNGRLIVDAEGMFSDTTRINESLEVKPGLFDDFVSLRIGRKHTKSAKGLAFTLRPEGCADVPGLIIETRTKVGTLSNNSSQSRVMVSKYELDLSTSTEAKFTAGIEQAGILVRQMSSRILAADDREIRIKLRFTKNQIKATHNDVDALRTFIPEDETVTGQAHKPTTITVRYADGVSGDLGCVVHFDNIDLLKK